ncbi:MAG: hypothetical protein COV74_00525 [Candidatus Omnitrophica bacterium CG11_big_fil_rev_8_21_14_0_20_45_26]|uniref:Uncharacterized protein n=1 Tax=Candidatus Abzuiibacterium crystallinum TaxID=1974748 RepID=A0A2H0LSV9_9BACT|nr:MAG: hypothetical protein COV74_00525 [Candidatus Omnitrophica bacterium CG11_big_fil_rev_8_21_14_0_20_45_26]PIW63373.1 MAG: hypothetical protein COW12_10605 [Candidatus Omnitrophica bacterium CG12_big_fil_rev_8_21_14_0_65_45_16]
MKFSIRCFLTFFLIPFTLYFCLPLTAGYAEDAASNQNVQYLLRDSYFLSPELQFRFNTYSTEGFLLTGESRPNFNSDFSIVTGFEGSVIASQVLPHAHSIEDAQKIIAPNVKTHRFMDVMIKELAVPLMSGQTETRYWIGQQSFATFEQAQAGIVSVKTAIESQGGDFKKAIEAIETYAPFEPKQTTAEALVSRSQREEALAIKAMDYLGIGEKLFGPLQAPSPFGEKILWQSFGETSYRPNNLERDNYDSQVFFWTNRIVFKGIWGPFDTSFDPYLEVTPTLETNGTDFKSNLQLQAGIQWYPFIRHKTFTNFQPFGLSLLDFAHNFRFFVQYGVRENLKDEITSSSDTDIKGGVDIFYEWGLDLPPLGQKPIRHGAADYIHDYVWGEFFGSYTIKRTDFSSIEGYNSFVMNSSLILGAKWPTIPLPSNPVNDELTLMPYFKFEHVNNANHPLYYQNQFLVSAGIRVMPFRSYRFSENEWLYKTKLYVEYVGIGGGIWPIESAPSTVPNHDIRFGMSFSQKRF